MKRNHMHISVMAATAAALLSGCGGGSGSEGSEAASTNTGVGYYLDSAVKGVTFTCGTISGITDEEGKFTYVKGESCMFTLAGLPLRNVPADLLEGDDIRIVENNTTVAAFLQSMDIDGDPSNGIEITPEIVDALEETVKAEALKSVPVAETLDAVVSSLDGNVEAYEGQAVSEEAAKAHLEKTLTSVTQSLLGGKTFHIVYMDDGRIISEQAVFNEDVSEVTVIKKDGSRKTNSVTLSADRVYWEDGSYSRFEPRKEGVYEALEYDMSGSRNGSTMLFATPESQKAYISETIRKMIRGRTLYYADEAKTFLASLDVASDGLTWSYTMIVPHPGSGEKAGDTGTEKLVYDGRRIKFGDEGLEFVRIGSEYIVWKNIVTGEMERTYFSETDAKRYMAYAGTSGTSSAVFTEEMLSGRTVYEVYFDEDVKSIGKLTFDPDGTAEYEGLEGEEAGNRFTGTWKVLENGVLLTTVKTVNGKPYTPAEGETDAYTHTIVESDGKYIKAYYAEEGGGYDYYFTDLAEAKAFTPDEKTASSGSGSSESITGTWYYSREGTNVLVHFFSDGTYFFGEVSDLDGDGGMSGIEYGNYTYDITTGTFEAKPKTDTNGEWGFSHPRATLKMQADNGVLSVEEGDTVYKAEMLEDISGRLNGTWFMNEDDTHVLIAFIAGADDTTGWYVHMQEGSADGSGSSGVEFGTYSRETDGTTTFSPQADTNGEWGFSHPKGALKLSVENETLTVSEGSDIYVAHRAD